MRLQRRLREDQRRVPLLSALSARLLPRALDASVPAWARAIGVTRVARVTGLDRCGVEVACAIRPAGDILQVSNGKGATFAAAKASALSEALELWSCEHPDPARIAWDRPAGPSFWQEDILDGAAPGLDERAVRAWARAERLDARGLVHVPAGHVWCPSEGEASVGVRTRAWTANGVAAHPDRAEARWNGLCELLEREAVCRVFPQGWTPAHLARRSLRSDNALLTTLAARGFVVHLVDATPKGWPVPVVAALVAEPDGRGPAIAAGYACRRDPHEAAEAALHEACQSRLTEIHGAREDVSQTDTTLPDWLVAIRKPRRTVRDLPRWTGSMRALLTTMGLTAAAVDLTPRGAPVHVTRVFVPGFRMSELLL